MWINHNLKWSNHLNEIVSKVSRQLRLMCRLAWFLPRRALICFYRSYIRPSFDYCSLVWRPCSIHDSVKLQRLQNFAVRIILWRDTRSSATSALGDLGWMPLTERRTAAFKSLCQKILNAKAPNCLTDVATKSLSSSIHSHFTRHVSKHGVIVSCAFTEFGKRSVTHQFALTVNSFH